jgi:hypothetical protein
MPWRRTPTKHDLYNWSQPAEHHSHLPQDLHRFCRRSPAVARYSHLLNTHRYQSGSAWANSPSIVWSVTEIPDRVGAPARRAFAAAGYTTLEQLLAVDEKELLALHGVGPRAIRILREEAQNR